MEVGSDVRVYREYRHDSVGKWGLLKIILQYSCRRRGFHLAVGLARFAGRGYAASSHASFKRPRTPFAI